MQAGIELRTLKKTITVDDFMKFNAIECCNRHCFVFQFANCVFRQSISYFFCRIMKVALQFRLDCEKIEDNKDCDDSSSDDKTTPLNTQINLSKGDVYKTCCLLLLSRLRII